MISNRVPVLIPTLVTALLAPLMALGQVENLVDPAAVSALLEKRSVTQRFVPGEMIVKLKGGADVSASMASLSAAVQDFGMEARPERTSGGELLFRIPAAQAATLAAADLERRTMDAVSMMAQDPNVEYAQPNFILDIAVTPNDPGYALQWHYFENGTGAGQSPGGIGLPDAWNQTTGNAAIVVAVIDTGILPAHPDIAAGGNLVPGFDMISSTFIANDGDGRDADPTDPGDAVSANECGGSHPPQTDSWHGTHVAGTVGVGATNNAAGVAGVNWHVSVQAVRVLGKCGGTTVDINDAIRWAAGLPVPAVPANATPARVINMSLGGPGACASSPSMQAAINDALAQGVTVVVAAGNDAMDAAGFSPAGCNGVITVAAADYRGRLVSRYSNFGDSVEILAPGGDVRRDDNDDEEPDGVLSMVQGGYAFYNGTSMAAPHVAGVAALLLAADPSLTPSRILNLIQGNSLPRSLTECAQPCGAGLLQAGAPAGPVVTLSPALISLRRNQSETLTATVTAGGNPLPGVTVSFASAAPDVATVSPATAITDALGNAVATVTSQNRRDDTTVTAEASGATRPVPVRVVRSASGASPWGMLIAIAVALWLMRRRLVARA